MARRAHLYAVVKAASKAKNLCKTPVCLNNQSLIAKFWRGMADVKLATLEWVDWFNHRRLLEPIGYVPSAEYEKAAFSLLMVSPPIGRAWQ